MNGLEFVVMAALVPAAITLAVLHLWLRRGDVMPLDVANERSLHTGAIPRIGGIAMSIGVGISLLIAPSGLSLMPVLVSTGGLFVLSSLDDWYSLPVVPRLLGHFVAAGMVVMPLELTFVPAMAVWLLLVWITNLYNFMDGADGLAGGMAAIGFGTYALVAWPDAPGIAWISLSLAGASVGFLVLNFPPARVFMGDAGAIPLGFLAGAIGMAGWWDGIWPIWFPWLVFSPFIADSTVTLLRRLRERKKIWQAHREHHYQRLALSKLGRRPLALFAWGLMLAVSASALLLLHLASLWQWSGVVLILTLYGALFRLINQRWQRTTIDETP